MKKVCIDPGHGGHDPGACANSIRESDLVLTIALMARDMLESHVDVLMTRDNDQFVSLSERCNMANDADCDIFVSLHANCAINTDAHGVETFTSGSEESRKLAMNILMRHLEAVSQRNRGVKKANFHVIRNTTMPAVLHEFGFVSNLNEAERLLDEDNQKRMARAVADGVLDYFAEHTTSNNQALTLEERVAKIEHHLGLS